MTTLPAPAIPCTCPPVTVDFTLEESGPRLVLWRRTEVHRVNMDVLRSGYALHHAACHSEPNLANCPTSSIVRLQLLNQFIERLCDILIFRSLDGSYLLFENCRLCLGCRVVF